MAGESSRMEEIRNSKDPLFLIEVFRKGTDEERSAAVDAFAILPSSKYIALLNALKGRNPNVRIWVAKTIGRTGQVDAAPPLVCLLQDRHPDVRVAAFNVVTSLIEPDKLLRMMQADMDKAKSKSAKERLRPYIEKARLRCQLESAGLDRIDINELKDLKGKRFLVRGNVPPAPGTPTDTAARKKAFA